MFGLICGAVLCIAISFGGLVIKRKYKTNADFMTAYVDFIAYVKTEIYNNKTPIFTIIDNYIAKETNIFTKVLKVINGNLKRDVVDNENYPKECALVDKKNIKMLISDIASIGKYDSVTEVNKLNAILERVKVDAEKANVKYKKDGVMAFKLSVLVGIAVMIILC